MQVILLHPRLAQAKSITLTNKHLLLAALGFWAAAADVALRGWQAESDPAARHDKFLK